MRKDMAIWPNPQVHLAKCAPDVPVLYFCPETLRSTARRFQGAFDGLVTYAVKANDRAEVLDNLVGAGLRAFDVASPWEMEAVRRALPDAVLHYHNPVRSRPEVVAAVGHGIASWSVDCFRELEKLADVPRQGIEIAVRLRLPVAGAAYDFGEKFGADPDQAVGLLRQVVEMGFAASITFHPGTQCNDPQAWAVYIVEAADVAARAGVTLKRLNVGGGFAAHRTGSAPDLEAILQRISREVARVFGVRAPELVCEPGRAMVADAFSLAVRVKAVRDDGSVFLNDGVYGGLTEMRDIGNSDRVEVLRGGLPVRGPRRDRVIFGPTCDSIDRLPQPMPLPACVDEGDHLLIHGMGAYSQSLSTRFNGYGLHDVVTVQGL